jgi:hypothetical protein
MPDGRSPIAAGELHEGAKARRRGEKRRRREEEGRRREEGGRRREEEGTRREEEGRRTEVGLGQIVTPRRRFGFGPLASDAAGGWVALARRAAACAG